MKSGGTEDNHTAQRSLPAQRSDELPEGLLDLVDDLKEIVRRSHVRAQLSVNTEMIRMYWDIGRAIVQRREKEDWGSKVVSRISVELRTAFPNQRGFSRSSLHYMQKLAGLWPEPIVQQAAGQLPWAHLQLLMDKCETRPELDFYAGAAVQQGWSRQQLSTAIEHQLHESHGAALTNFSTTLPEESEAVHEVVKDPYRLDFTRLTGGAGPRRRAGGAARAVPHRVGRRLRVRRPPVPGACR